MDSTVLVFGIIALIAIAILIRSFLKFIKFNNQEELPNQVLKISNQVGQQSKPAVAETKVKTKVKAKVETKVEAKPAEPKPAAEQRDKPKKEEKPAMPPVKVQGPSEEESEQVARIERILIKHFENRPGGVVVQGKNGDGNNVENLRSLN